MASEAEWKSSGAAGWALLGLNASPEGSSAGAGVLVFRGRGWYLRLTALLGSTAAAAISLVVVATDAEDPDLRHARRLGLRSVSALEPGEPLAQLWREWAHFNEVNPFPPPALAHPAAALDADAEQSHTQLLKRGLSRREADVALLAGKGWGNPEIAKHLFLSEVTVKGHLRRVYRKLGVARRSGLLALFE